MKKIKICRPYESFNKNYSYKVMVEKNIIAELKNNEEKIIKVEDNKPIKAKISWCGSKEIKIDNHSENIKLMITGNKLLNHKLPLFSSTFLVISLIIFRLKFFPKIVGISIFGIFILLLIGTLTIWKDKWIDIEVN